VLLRMDSATQIDVLSKAVGSAIMSPDEARAKRNLGPVPGGATPYLQQQNYSLAALAKRDSSDDPFGTAKPPAPPPPAAETAAPEDDDAPPPPAKASMGEFLKALMPEAING
jgi:hypothetical protein